MSIEFDLTNDNNKCVFRNNKGHTVSSLYEGQELQEPGNEKIV